MDVHHSDGKRVPKWEFGNQPGNWNLGTSGERADYPVQVRKQGVGIVDQI